MRIIVNDNNVLPVYSWCDNIDSLAMEQIDSLANHPCAFHHIAIMPDCAVGYGMPIGGVVAFKKTVAPYAVGSDAGCGMHAIRTGILAKDLTRNQIVEIRRYIKQRIPVGNKVHDTNRKWEGFEAYSNSLHTIPPWLTPSVWDRVLKSLGTLGGGNHFIEIQEGDDGYIWLMLHSGSRSLGNKIADYYQKVSKKLNEMWLSPVPYRGLPFLPVDSEIGEEYLRDVNFALYFAFENRRRMMGIVIEGVKSVLPRTIFDESIDVHHNYATIENHFGENVWVHRKGAISAKKGEIGIVPGSMGDPSYIVQGLGNRDSFMSCAHGAGRDMSRTEASAKLDIAECNKSMEGIVFGGWGPKRGGACDLSEAPDAYKDIEKTMDAQKDLVEVVVKLKPRGVVKEKEDPFYEM